MSGVGTTVFSTYYGIIKALVWPTFFVLLYLFPDGRFTPRWTGWLAPLPFLVFLFMLWNDPKNLLLTLGQWLILLFAVGGIASQVYRYRRISTTGQRQQTKWVMYVLGVVIASTVIQQVILLLDPELSIGTRGRFWFDLWGNYLLGTMIAALIPISMGISILRYRLWDIDILIRRTFSYAILTIALGLLYFGSVVLFQGVLGRLFADGSQVVIVLSTLLIAALFNPLRREIQAGIDRRFYRSKYDAARAIEEFSTAARRDVDLDHLTGQLVNVVQKNVQPEQVSLWIRYAKHE